MPKINWTVHPLTLDPDYPDPMYAIIPDDGTRGLLIGEMPEVQAMLDRLTAFVATGQHDGEISDLDPRLGTPWLTVAEASYQYDIPVSSITWACRKHLIRDARKSGRSWEFPQRTFLAWLVNRPGSGRHS